MRKLVGKGVFFTNQVIRQLSGDGTKVPTALITYFGENITDLYNITEEYLSGPILGAVLREITRRIAHINKQIGVMDEVRALGEADACLDWKAAGYNDKSSWLDAVEPYGYDRSSATSLITFYKTVMPRIEKIDDLNPMMIFINTPSTSLIKMTNLLLSQTLNNHGLRLMCYWIRDGISQVTISTLETSSLVKNWLQISERLEAQGLVPWEVFYNLGEVGKESSRRYITDGIDKALLMADMMSQGEIPDDKLESTLIDAAETPTRELVLMNMAHHTPNTQQEIVPADDDLDETPKPRATHVATKNDDGEYEVKLTPGMVDEHTPMALYLQHDGNGYYKIVRGVVSAEMLRKIQGKVEVALFDVDSGKPFTLNANLERIIRKS